MTIPEILYNKIARIQNETFECVSMLNRYHDDGDGSQDSFVEIENRLINAKSHAERDLGQITEPPSAVQIRDSLIRDIETNYNTLINMMQYFKIINANDQVRNVSIAPITRPPPAEAPSPSPPQSPTKAPSSEFNAKNEFIQLAKRSSQRYLELFDLDNELNALAENIAIEPDASSVSRLECASILTRALLLRQTSVVDFGVLRETSAFTPARIKKLDSILDYIFQICMAMREKKTLFLQQRIGIRTVPSNDNKSGAEANDESAVVIASRVSFVYDILSTTASPNPDDIVLCRKRQRDRVGNLIGNDQTFEEILFTTHPELYTAASLANSANLIITNLVKYNDSMTDLWTERPVNYDRPHVCNVGMGNDFESLVASWSVTVVNKPFNVYVNLNDERRIFSATIDPASAAAGVYVDALLKRIYELVLICEQNRCNVRVEVAAHREQLESELKRLPSVVQVAKLRAMISGNK
ncbi:hypothetical protein SlsnVgp098 [Spodoptera littoralis nucleopolyhedrovirus]|uniref:Uncharacterized protein n=1 Tax=Spodoptera littoralis nuclear polyhedrosis virus TaxID=10456 RepID=M1JNY6_NPVSL|nr:hypothetical protein SlsnVgp098 [Spodoptera littoralis nucleopolyhedrovirus]AGE89953.1 hypothetical protein SlsnVgp098 [Spodoptera littoralis nucleopolyhedrovirus]